jgi:hypothetical protein
MRSVAYKRTSQFQVGYRPKGKSASEQGRKAYESGFFLREYDSVPAQASLPSLDLDGADVRLGVEVLEHMGFVDCERMGVSKGSSVGEESWREVRSKD